MITTPANISSHSCLQEHCQRINLKQMCLFSKHLFVAERSWQMYVWPNMRFYPCIYLDRLRRTTENFSQVRQHLNQSIYLGGGIKNKKIIKNKKARVLQAQKILVDSPRDGNVLMKTTCVVNTVITQWRHGYGNAGKTTKLQHNIIIPAVII